MEKKRKFKGKFKADQLSTKGELVRDQEERILTGEEDILQDNPFKTPPSNLTNKNREYDLEKG
ncbi:MAG: hypothetical protein GX088_03840 [Clostridia bacterium]|nr:hypothetical protein [Clostridia bacterium]